MQINIFVFYQQEMYVNPPFGVIKCDAFLQYLIAAELERRNYLKSVFKTPLQLQPTSEFISLPTNLGEKD